MQLLREFLEVKKYFSIFLCNNLTNLKGKMACFEMENAVLKGMNKYKGNNFQGCYQ